MFVGFWGWGWGVGWDLGGCCLPCRPAGWQGGWVAWWLLADGVHAAWLAGWLHAWLASLADSWWRWELSCPCDKLNFKVWSLVSSLRNKLGLK